MNFVYPLKRVIRRIFKSLNQESPIDSSHSMWYGNFESWTNLQPLITGYDSDHILQNCKAALLKIRNGEAVYERDTQLFDNIQYDWVLLANLLKIAVENDGNLCVVDFGGSLGSTYYQNKSFLSGIKNLKWCIIEQENFVKCGKETFQTEQLEFYYTINDCLKHYNPNVILLSSVLQYLEEPLGLLDEIGESNIPHLILDRISVVDRENDLLTIQNVPDTFYKAKLGHWFFSKQKLLAKLAPKFQLIVEESSFAEESILLEGKINCDFKILILTRK